MIDIKSEQLLSFNDAVKTLPARRKGKKTNASCLYRWANFGCKGVKLETIQIGGTKCTSMEALQRFFERLSVGTEESDSQPKNELRSVKAGNRAVSESLKALEAMDIK